MSKIKDAPAFPDGDNLFDWVGSVTGSTGTAYEGCTYKLALKFGPEYPFKAPTISFTTPVRAGGRPGAQRGRVWAHRREEERRHERGAHARPPAARVCTLSPFAAPPRADVAQRTDGCGAAGAATRTPCRPPSPAQIWHPNVDQSGNICLDILKDAWSAALSVSTVLLSIQALLAEPNPASPLNAQAAAQWANPAEYRRVVVAKYAEATSGGGKR